MWVAILAIGSCSGSSSRTRISRDRPMLKATRAAAPIFSAYFGRTRTRATLFSGDFSGCITKKEKNTVGGYKKRDRLEASRSLLIL